jgi:hypothetical protein
LVDDFWKIQEGLIREVWGLGTLRGCLARNNCDFAWCQEWAQHVKQ